MCLTMKVKQFFVILTIILCTKCQFNSNPPCLITINIKELLILEESLWRKINTTSFNEASSEKKTLITQKIDLVPKFENFGDILESNCSNDLGFGLEVLQSIEKWRKVEELLRNIDAFYKTFRRLQRQHSAPETRISSREVWITFAKTVLNHPIYSIRSILDKIGEYINGQLFLNIIKNLDENAICISHQSTNQLFHNLYNSIELTIMKGYVTVQFSYMFLEIYEKKSFSEKPQMEHVKFVNRSLEIANAMSIIMRNVSIHFWRCDPKEHRRGETYLEIIRLFQGYIENEINLNKQGKCTENCGFYTSAKSYSCHKKTYCKKEFLMSIKTLKCQGATKDEKPSLLNCKYIASNMRICPDDITTGRRYKYIEYDNGRILGNKVKCNTIEARSWWATSNSWKFSHCSNCLCICDAHGIYSDRYIGLHGAVSDVTKNKVVTGLRFTKQHRIIHLQVQQGTLLPHGVIDVGSIEWVPVDNFTMADRYIYKRQDYYVLDSENRAIDLDNLYGKEGTVLTGVRFKAINSHINFEIRITPFDFESGKLGPLISSEWVDNINGGKKRTRIPLHKPGVPTTKSTLPSKILSRHNQYVEFTHTDIDKDAAQTTVPFFDAQDVVPKIPVLSCGAGIYFKSSCFSGGFIGLKLFTYNFHKHVKFTIDEISVE